MKEDQKQKSQSFKISKEWESIIKKLENNSTMKLAEKFHFLPKERECHALLHLPMESKEFM